MKYKWNLYKNSDLLSVRKPSLIPKIIGRLRKDDTFNDLGKKFPCWNVLFPTPDTFFQTEN